MIEKLLQIFKRPITFISALGYFVTIFGINTVFNTSILNIFTLLLIPATALIIYSIWNLFYNNNLSEEINDAKIKSECFPKISNKYEKKINLLFKIRDEIKKTSKFSDINPLKESLITEIGNINLNELVLKYARNCVKIQFIEDFLQKKSQNLKSVRDKIEKLMQAKKRYEKLNEDIYNTFETIQTQTVLILADDISIDIDSKSSLDEINRKIRVLDATNNEVNEFYTSINR